MQSTLVALLGLGLVVAAMAAGEVRSQTIGKPPLSAAKRDAVRQAVSAVGLISVRNATDASTPRPKGSAVFISRDGLVATNYHVISYESPQAKIDKIFDELFISLTNDNALSVNLSKRFRLQTVQVNKYQDLALLRVVGDNGEPIASATFPALEIGDSRAVKLLDDIFIIGFPEKGGSTITINTGVVEGKDNLDNWIKTDARMIHGNSGGAAVNADGKLIGIPTKVMYDTRKTEKEDQQIGAVGYLRPADLLVEMMKKIKVSPANTIASIPPQNPPPVKNPDKRKLTPKAVPNQSTIIVRGVVKSALDGKPVAGVRVGLVAAGSASVTSDSLLAWGGTNADGKFALNNPVALGRYTVKVKAIGYEVFTRDIEVTQGASSLTIELRPLR
ncbi:MAG: trypsin-like peptidase domain-containing protein [Acidobacteria bacterium]|nr:trypsin-like peptidase domain-containing protein [Acidobacteriota bacterium]